jgi:Amt family ammonium transporter
VTQLIAVVVTYIIAAVGTLIILKILDATVGLRLKPEAEVQGMDINEHGEDGYGEEFGIGLALLPPIMTTSNLLHLNVEFK